MDLQVEGVPSFCGQCKSPLCLRKQVINLALGNTDRMLCLVCLARDNGSSERELLLSVKDYLLSRECFRKEWVRYENNDFCPDPLHCYPDDCFC